MVRNGASFGFRQASSADNRSPIALSNERTRQEDMDPSSNMIGSRYDLVSLRASVVSVGFELFSRKRNRIWINVPYPGQLEVVETDLSLKKHAHIFREILSIKYPASGQLIRCSNYKSVVGCFPHTKRTY